MFRPPRPGMRDAGMISVNVVVMRWEDPAPLVRFPVEVAGDSTFETLAAIAERHLMCTRHDLEDLRVAGFFSLGQDDDDNDAAISARIRRDNVLPPLHEVCESHGHVIALVISTWGGHPNFDGCRAFHRYAPTCATQLVEFLGEEEGDEPVLSLPTRCSRESKLYARDAYKQLAGCLSTYMADQTKAFVVTGTPGIGKTIFLWYLLRMFRKQSAVVVFDCDGEFLLVHPNGVILSGVRGVSFLRYLSDPDTIYLCGAMPQHEPLFSVCIAATTIVTASPDPPLLQQFVKDVRPKVLCMPVWSLEELEACRVLCYKSITSKETVAALYACFGGTAQDTLVPDQDLAMALEKFHTEMKALSDADIQMNMNIMERSYFEEIKICHRLVHLQPMKDDTGADQFDEVLLQPASEAACCEIVRRMTVASARTVQKALPPTDRVSQLVASHEALFEGWAYNTLIAGGVFKIRKLGVGNECDRVVEHKTIAAQSCSIQLFQSRAISTESPYRKTSLPWMRSPAPTNSSR